MVKPRERGRCGESVTMLMGWQYLQTMHRALAAGRQQRLEDIEQARLQRPPRGACETQLSARLDGRSTRKNAATETEDRSKVGYQHHYPQHYPSCYHPSCITDPACSEKPPPLPPSRDFETTTSLDYQWPQVDEHYNQTRGQRRMRTLDNAPTRGRDRTFLVSADGDMRQVTMGCSSSIRSRRLMSVWRRRSEEKTSLPWSSRTFLSLSTLPSRNSSRCRTPLRERIHLARIADSPCPPSTLPVPLRMTCRQDSRTEELHWAHDLSTG